MRASHQPRKLQLPPMFFATSISASLCFAAGLLGLFAPETFPPLAEPSLAYALIGLAIFLEGWAISILISTSRERVKQQEKLTEHGRRIK